MNLIRKKSIIVVAVLGFGLVGIAWAQPSSPATPRSPASSSNEPGFRATGDGPPARFYSPESLSPGTINGLRDPEAILDDVLARYGGEAIINARFDGPTPGWTATEDPNAPPPAHFKDGRWLYTTVAADATGAQSVQSIWEATLVAGAVRDRLRMAGVDGDLIASNVDLKLPDGTIIPYAGGGMGRVVFMQSFSDASSESIENSVRAVAGELGIGLKVLSVSVLRPLQAAPAIIVSTANARQFVKNAGAIITTLLGGKAVFEGAYVEVRDADGKAVFISATGFRTGVGVQWVRGDLNPRLPASASLGGG